MVALVGAVAGDYLAGMVDAGLHVVVVGEPPESISVPVALPDNVRGIEAATDHLVEHGHTGSASSAARVPDVTERLAAFLGRMARHGLQVREEHVIEAFAFDAQAGADAARRLLAAGELPSALMVGTDANAVGVLEALAEAGLRVPQDIAVVALDGRRVGLHAPAAGHRAPVASWTSGRVAARAGPGPGPRAGGRAAG